MELVQLLFSCILIGLVGSSHCIGMCGGIANALNYSLPKEKQNTKTQVYYQIYYNFGRILSYSLMGALFGFIGHHLHNLMGYQGLFYLRLASAIVVIFIGLYLTGVWKFITKFEQFGKIFWNKLTPLSKKLLPINHPLKALGLGAVWGWLPCGLVYSTLALALTSGGLASGALAMFAFGLGTIPAMLSTAVLLKWFDNIFNLIHFRQLSGIIMIGLGTFALFHIIPTLLSNSHQCH